jgi:hypothetical protein
MESSLLAASKATRQGIKGKEGGKERRKKKGKGGKDHQRKRRVW